MIFKLASIKLIYGVEIISFLVRIGLKSYNPNSEWTTDYLMIYIDPWEIILRDTFIY